MMIALFTISVLFAAANAQYQPQPYSQSYQSQSPTYQPQSYQYQPQPQPYQPQPQQYQPQPQQYQSQPQQYQPQPQQYQPQPQQYQPEPQQYQPQPQQYQPQPQQYQPEPQQNQRQVNPAAVHYVNIGAELNGDYKFGYDTGKDNDGQSFREETRLPDGSVKGAYGYVDETGKRRIFTYTAGKDGFKVEGDDIPKAPPAPAPAAPSPPAQPNYNNYNGSPNYEHNQY